jgi:hypothetical protein
LLKRTLFAAKACPKDITARPTYRFLGGKAGNPFRRTIEKGDVLVRINGEYAVGYAVQNGVELFFLDQSRKRIPLWFLGHSL